MSETQDEINEREWRRFSNWIGGRYASALDTRLWVPKRPGTGSGFTLNFAQRGARTAMLGMTLIPVLLLLLVVLLLILSRGR